MFVDSRHAWHFRKGVEEAKKFLPSDDKLVIDLEACGFSQQEASKQRSSRVAQVDVVDKRDCANTGSRSRKKPNGEDLAMQEGRNNKQSAVCSEETLPSEMFDKVLLYNKNESLKVGVDAVVANLQDKASKISDGNQLKGSNVGKGRGKKQAKKKVVDLRTLLIHCAQAVAADDRWTANEVLKQIRQHSSPSGDGSQRLAHCFADGLEARLAGTGSQIYRSLIAKKTTASDILKAYQLYLAACPFKRISHFFSNQTILNVSEKASRIHIIDFGIYFGFQWPCLIQRLSYRAGGPPNLRITGIDVAQPGFRPTERIEETGQRLQDYARSFNVPFEFNAITSKWEAITVKDLKIRKDEVLIVNCLYRFRNLVDETVIVDSPRNMVLNTIRQASPDVFIHGIVNGSYSAPFFVTRFREALFHYSALFDMLETTVPREDEQRRLIERDLFGREALNVISCESSERVERPETYKQWQARNLRAGFEQLPLDPDIMKRARDKVKTSYHKDFVIDESSRWLLQGWKGRIIYAISTWRPNKVL
ncbi:scarecrow-like protein 9 [Dioscorea cayenensis subsp. rotundata]|uniref:Scarecrow-like protein 9 n=1 Tax=Dioscorea cayennensis subsp. rotundata TaxID=55577 RepID=A0AB40BPN0_DIOCR|nr:scarecrow-like protein 9 [Dioscorea cayenensis subsp. rotundata]